MRLLSAKSEELEALREGEPADGEAAVVHGDALGDTAVMNTGSAGSTGSAMRGEARGDEADELARTVSLPPAADRLPGDALSETVSLTAGGDHDHMRMRPHADSTSSDVPQDVAEETARAVAEAGVVDQAPDGIAGIAGTGEGTEEGGTGAPLPERRQRHTPLYGRGFRVLPWKHKARLNPKQRRRRKIVVRSLWGCVLLFFGTVAWSIADALTSPGTDTVQARLAEWGHDHGLAGVVTTLEQWQYDLNPPSKGGSVDAKQFTDLGPTTAAERGQAVQERERAGQVRRAEHPGPRTSSPCSRACRPRPG